MSIKSNSHYQRFLKICFTLVSCIYLSVGLAMAAEPQMCGVPPATGNPLGPPAEGGTPACGAQAGNPLNVMNGNKFQTEVDMPALPGVLGLELVRYYNSEYSWPESQRGILGRGWRLSYDAELRIQKVGTSVTLEQADGTRVGFQKAPQQSGPANTTHYISAQIGQGGLQAQRSSAGMQYTLTLPNQTRQTFNAQGKLTQILAPTGEFVTLQRDAAGFLLRVTDPQGRSLTLSYLDKKTAQTGDRFRGVQHIDTPLGRFDYAYGSTSPKATTASPKIDPILLLANLVRVSIPTQATPKTPIQKTYHYEDAHFPTLLTGITLQGQGSDGQAMDQRLSTWAYDKAGRAVLSVKGAYDPAKAGIEQVSLVFGEQKPDGSGTTVLTNSLGQTTRYHYARINGRLQLLEVRGPGCATCGPSNVRYAFDSQGRRTHVAVLDAKGQEISATLTRYDSAHRPIQISTVRYANGKAQAPQLRERYEYGTDSTSTEPTLVARPSVVPGKEHTIRISYNPAGQITRMLEEGFSPLDANGQIASTSSGASAISRSTTYTYTTINGRSVLAAIDGPLPNGPANTPADSDITTFSYDARADYLVALTQPGSRQSKLTYDAAGRIATVQNAEGFSTAFTFDAMHLIQTRSSGPGWAQPNVQSFKYDALGQRTETGTGSVADNSYRPQTRQSFDALGRLQWSASALGMLTQNHFDTESNLIETGRYSNQMAQVQHYAYDALGRLSAAANNKGAAYQITYNEQGGLESITDALGRVTGHAGAQPRAPQASPSQPARVRQYADDFGRNVASVSADSGTTTRRFDAANRLIASTDAQNNRAVYQHDVQGRIQQQTITDAKTGKDTVTRWQYQGQHLIALEHPTQSERYAYDARGLRVARSVTLRVPGNGSNSAGSAGSTDITSTTRYIFDAAGALQSTSLPDGSELIYERNGQGQVTTLKRSPLHSPWVRNYLSWLAPAQTIVQDLQRDLVGLKSYTAGNGIQAQFQRSAEGALARVVYRNSSPVKTQTAANAAPPWPTLLGRSTQDTINLLLGVGSAHAAGVPASSAPGQAPAAQAPRPLPGALSLPADPQALIDQRYLWDVAGNLLYTQGMAGAGDANTSSYAYDGKDQLIVAVQTQGHDKAQSETASRYYYQAGKRVLNQRDISSQSDLTSNTRRVQYQGASHRWLGEFAADDAAHDSAQAQYNANGQPNKVGQREYVWDALGQLISVRQQDQSLASYTYSHRGERIGKTVSGATTQYLYNEAGQVSAELDANGRITRQYLYLADQPIAVIDTPDGETLSNQELLAQEPRGLEAKNILKTLWHNITTSSAGQLVWLHTNHLGAPQAATGAGGQVLWQASYAAFGAARTVGVSGFTQNLRLPGQYFDAETGLHYNRHRYYDPSRGEYLTPDPLGTPDGPNPYAYVRYNPLKYVDPDGLILFAFDGTGNANDLVWLAQNNTGLSNVAKFYDAYDQIANGKAFYITGIGTTDQNMPYKGNMLDGDGFDQRVALGFTFLDNLIKTDAATSTLDIDVVGFSRGAAEARVWINQLVGKLINGAYTVDGKSRCVNLRFEGLWDSVPHLGLLNGDEVNYDFSIPSAVKFVAHANALNEYRGGAANFNSRSILANPNQGSSATRVEKGFLGAHSDIGGGYATGDLSDVALMWMIEQANGQLIKFDADKINQNGWNVVTNPVIHDSSSNLMFGAPTGGPTAWSEDRELIYTDGTKVKERQVNSGTMTYADTVPFISYLANPNSHDNISGTVNAKAYIAWLNTNHLGYNYAIPVTAQ